MNAMRILPSRLVVLLAIAVLTGLPLCARATAQDVQSAAAGESVAPAQGETAAGATESPAHVLEFDLVDYSPSWARNELLGVPLWRYIIAFLFIMLGMVLRKISDFVFEHRIVPLLEKTRYEFDNLFANAASKPLGYLFVIGGFYAAIASLPLPAEPNLRGFAFGCLRVMLATDVVWFLFRCVDVLVHHLSKLALRTESKLDDQMIPVVRKALKITIGIICFVWVVQLLGYSVSSLLAGLGIGGLAVALALQDTLANFFGSVFIFIDRPFAIGDWIKIDDNEGIVEEVGFRSTRIRTWPTTLVTIPNKVVANATIDNWSKMPKRRVTQTIGVTYETTADQMERAVAGIRDILMNDADVNTEFLVVRFTEFGASSLDIMVLYFTKSLAFVEHAATKERINLAIMRLLSQMGLSIAFPTQTVYFEGGIARQMAEKGQPAGDKPERIG